MNESHPGLRMILGLIILGVVLAGVVGLATSVLLPDAQLHIGELCIVTPTLVYVIRKKFDLKSAFRLNAIDKKLTGISLVLGIAITILTDEVDRLLQLFIKMPPEFEDFILGLLKADTLLEGVWLFVAAVVLAGIIEEMLFRGLLQQAFERRLGVAHGLFFSALVFAFIHLNPWWMMQIIILGLLLGILAWRSDSIYPTILIHCINNAAALVLINFEPKFVGWYEWYGHVNPPIVAIAACLAFYALKGFWHLTHEHYGNSALGDE
ncbi:MAG TPA: type II CAAX endopeptidase family protein [bacterium]